jgi:hypothetical protein
MMTEMGITALSPPASDDVIAFLASEEAMKRAG